MSDPEIFRAATLDDYNEWLLAWIKQGGKIAHYRSRPYDDDYLVVQDPAAEIELMGMYGASSRSFIIPKEYSFKFYAHDFALGHCEVDGWAVTVDTVSWGHCVHEVGGEGSPVPGVKIQVPASTGVRARLKDYNGAPLLVSSESVVPNSVIRSQEARYGMFDVVVNII